MHDYPPPSTLGCNIVIAAEHSECGNPVLLGKNWIASPQKSIVACNDKKNKGFTLIEITIVLVVIGLITGGVFVVRELIRAAELRAQIKQIEEYNIAVNTFRLKYNALPGDIKEPEASSFGFSARGIYAGQGDGNGVLEGVYANAAGRNADTVQSGENLMFWVDLSAARLIKGTFNTAVPTTIYDAYSPSEVAQFIPRGKIPDGTVTAPKAKAIAAAKAPNVVL
jgi:prepilin-type N-terminal cleavage/methylation domain-containing protein